MGFLDSHLSRLPPLSCSVFVMEDMRLNSNSRRLIQRGEWAQDMREQSQHRGTQHRLLHHSHVGEESNTRNVNTTRPSTTLITRPSPHLFHSPVGNPDPFPPLHHCQRPPRALVRGSRRERGCSQLQEGESNYWLRRGRGIRGRCFPLSPLRAPGI